jgi:hypothetical protein
MLFLIDTKNAKILGCVDQVHSAPYKIKDICVKKKRISQKKNINL